MLHINVSIKIGEIVTIIDGSYMLAIDTITNKLTRFPQMEGFNGNLITFGHEYIVIAVNEPCPSDNTIFDSLGPANNCIIKDTTNNIIWFCSSINLKTKRNLFE